VDKLWINMEKKEMNNFFSLVFCKKTKNFNRTVINFLIYCIINNYIPM